MAKKGNKGKGKRLGNQWERDFCKELSLHWTHGEDEDVFWRTDNSGGRKGINEEAGDVLSVKQVGMPLIDKIVFELKRTTEKDFILDLIRFDKISKIRDVWWPKLLQEAEEWNREPLLIIKFVNRKFKAVVFSPYSPFYSLLGPHCKLVYKNPFYKEDEAMEFLIMDWENFKGHGVLLAPYFREDNSSAKNNYKPTD